MKHLKKFENFYLPPDVESTEGDDLRPIVAGRMAGDTKKSTIDYKSSMSDEEAEEYGDTLRPVVAGRMPGEEKEESHYSTMKSVSSEDDITQPPYREEDYFESKKSKAKSVSYKKSGLKRPDLADRNKNKKIEGWEKAVATKIEQSMAKKKKK